MPALTRVAASLTATGVLALTLVGNALAAPSPAADFGGHVAACAQEHLGQRTSQPQVTCTHGAMTMTFPTFGAMVKHMHDMHGA